MTQAAREYHLRGQLWPPARFLGAAPERHKDNRSDIYCLGAALLRQLPGETLHAPQLPQEAARLLQQLLARTLCPQSRGRYGCCEELLEDLDRLILLLSSCPAGNAQRTPP